MWPSFLAQESTRLWGKWFYCSSPFLCPPLPLSLSLSPTWPIPRWPTGVIKTGESRGSLVGPGQKSMCLNLLGIDCNQFLWRPVQGCCCKALSTLINGGLECSRGRDKVVAAAAGQSAASRRVQVQGQPLDPSSSPLYAQLPGRSVKTRWGSWKHTRDIPGSSVGGRNKTHLLKILKIIIISNSSS